MRQAEDPICKFEQQALPTGSKPSDQGGLSGKDQKLQEGSTAQFLFPLTLSEISTPLSTVKLFPTLIVAAPAILHPSNKVHHAVLRSATAVASPCLRFFKLATSASWSLLPLPAGVEAAAQVESSSSGMPRAMKGKKTMRRNAARVDSPHIRSADEDPRSDEIRALLS